VKNEKCNRQGFGKRLLTGAGMSWLIPKVLLRWKEPKVVFSARDKLEQERLKPWHRPALVLGCAATLMLSWAVGHLDPNKHPPPLIIAVPGSLVAALVFVYALPRLIDLIPPEIRIEERAIRRIRGNVMREWKYKDIEQIELLSQIVEEQSLSMLATTTSRRTDLLGIDPSLPVDKVSSLLVDRGVNVSRR